MDKNTAQETTYAIETTATKSQIDARQELEKLFLGANLSTSDLLFNIGLFTRSSVMVKFIYMSKIYERIKSQPGVFMEFGTWYGQNMVVLENLRAIYEPFNKQRKIIGFDTFEGYTPVSKTDRASAVWADKSYSTGSDYQAFLDKLLRCHEAGNILGHLTGNHQLVKGDVCKTVPGYFRDHPETIVAFAYFDLGLYEPTKAALQSVLDHSIPGTVILMDELTWPESPGEAIAFKELMKGRKYSIEKIDLYPSKAIVTLE